MSEEQEHIEPSKAVYVTNISFRTTWHYLKDRIRDACGDKVVYVDIPSSGGRSKGVAIVEFATIEDATEGIEKLNGLEIDGRSLRVRYDRNGGRNRNAGKPGCSIFISQLPYSTTWYDLKDLCREYGEVVYADIFTGADKRSKGVGVVRFAAPEAANAAIEALHKSQLMGRQINVRIYEEKPEREQEQEQVSASA